MPLALVAAFASPSFRVLSPVPFRVFISRVLSFFRNAERKRGEDKATETATSTNSLLPFFFFVPFDLDLSTDRSLFFRSLSLSSSSLPSISHNTTASESGKPIKVHHDKKGADEAGEGTRKRDSERKRHFFLSLFV